VCFTGSNAQPRLNSVKSLPDWVIFLKRSRLSFFINVVAKATYTKAIYPPPGARIAQPDRRYPNEEKMQIIRRPNQAICTHHVSVYGIVSPITTPWTCDQRKRIKRGRITESSLFSCDPQGSPTRSCGATGHQDLPPDGSTS